MIRNLLLFAFAIFSTTAFSQSDQGMSGNARTQEVERGIYLYQNRGGNILLAEGREGVLVVDSQFEDLADDLLKEIERLMKKKVQYLINTHHHGDHTGGNAKLREEGAVVFAQDNTRRRLLQMIQKAQAEGSKMNRDLLPVITFDQGINFYFDNERVEVRALPGGHTDGDAVVYFKSSNVIHTGDAFVHNTYPYFDTENGGSYQGYVEGLDAILSMIDDRTSVVPGHGEVGQKKDVQFLHSLLNTVYKRVRAEHLKGKSLSEIQAMTQLTAEYDQEGFGDGFITRERFVEEIYNAVSNKYDLRDIEEQKERFREAQEKAKELDPKYKGGGL